MSRFSRVLDRLLDYVPNGVELPEGLVEDDLIRDEDLIDLIGGEHPDALDLFKLRRQVPRARPLLVALAARAAGADEVDPNVQHAAELLHLTLLLHDLALGREGSLRRRVMRLLMKRSVSFFGSQHLTLRVLELVQHTHPDLMNEVLATLREFADGQALSRELVRGGFPTVDDWREHADAHTGALFSFCCRGGAYIGAASPSTRSSLGRYGRHLGRLWHIAEDLSSLYHGDGGPHLLARLASGRPVLLVAVSSDDPAVVSAWREMVADPCLETADGLAELLMAGPGASRTRERMVQESWSARKALSSLTASRYRGGLVQLAESLVQAGMYR